MISTFQFSQQKAPKSHGRAPGAFSPNSNYHPQSGGTTPLQNALPGAPEPQPYPYHNTNNLGARQQLLDLDPGASSGQQQPQSQYQYGLLANEDHRDLRRELLRVSPTRQPQYPGAVGGSGRHSSSSNNNSRNPSPQQQQAAAALAAQQQQQGNPYHSGLSSAKDLEHGGGQYTHPQHSIAATGGRAVPVVLQLVVEILRVGLLLGQFVEVFMAMVQVLPIPLHTVVAETQM
jgi:hypothetical protein